MSKRRTDDCPACGDPFRTFTLQGKTAMEHAAYCWNPNCPSESGTMALNGDTQEEALAKIHAAVVQEMKFDSYRLERRRKIA